jgi:hypothetical protein
MAGLTDGLGGSINERNPINTNPSSGKLGFSDSESNL